MKTLLMIVALVICLVSPVVGEETRSDLYNPWVSSVHYLTIEWPQFYCPIHGDIEANTIAFMFGNEEVIICLKCLSEWVNQHFPKVIRVK